METFSGRIMKATGGFYYVITEGKDGRTIECRARGIFRKDDTSPLVGDIVSVREDLPGKGTVVEIHDRKNSLLRPPLANLDIMVVTISTDEPRPNFFVADKYLAILEHSGIDAVIAVTKPDLAEAENVSGIYRRAGYEIFIINGITGEGADSLADALRGKLCAFSGNSGAGKSSVINAVMPSLDIATGGISKKLGRGRHTTRHVELYDLGNGTLAADTPGFSAIEISDDLGKDNLHECFREFAPYIGHCRFSDCSHTREKDCAILDAVENGEISQSRYRSYVMMVEAAAAQPLYK